MIPIAKTETNIQCSASEAFRLISNMERFREWFPAVISIRSVNDLPHGEVGKKYLETVSIPLRGERDIELTVKESTENKRFVTEGKFPPLLPRMEVQINQTGGTEVIVKWAMFSRSKSRVVQFLLLPLAKSIMQKRANIGAANLKALLEKANS